jgi:hypothetical protein
MGLERLMQKGSEFAQQGDGAGDDDEAIGRSFSKGGGKGESGP